ncbi:hypothetical protein R3P38DRAFT_1374410 [Favolaschia claudopus]|uniref:Uncharacterized protein n=1 Tax=Favolaschia claudopus TaxID=2862362 RepID=A0AAW0DYD2_9AGAR
MALRIRPERIGVKQAATEAFTVIMEQIWRHTDINEVDVLEIAWYTVLLRNVDLFGHDFDVSLERKESATQVDTTQLGLDPCMSLSTGMLRRRAHSLMRPIPRRGWMDGGYAVVSLVEENGMLYAHKFKRISVLISSCRIFSQCPTKARLTPTFLADLLSPLLQPPRLNCSYTRCGRSFTDFAMCNLNVGEVACGALAEARLRYSCAEA